MSQITTHVLGSVAAFRHIPTRLTSEILHSACTNLYGVHSWKISLIGGINYEGHRNGPLQSPLVRDAMGFYEITIIAMAVKKARRYHERRIWEKVKDYANGFCFAYLHVYLKEPARVKFKLNFRCEYSSLI